jgi:hypothetical protein
MVKDVVGVKGEPIKSTIVYKDADGAKQNVGTFQTHLSYLNIHTSINKGIN